MNAKPQNFVNVSIVDTADNHAVITMSSLIASSKTLVQKHRFDSDADYRKEVFEDLYNQVKEKNLHFAF
jgi:hypothetical protein